jgi:hypothetical protein
LPCFFYILHHEILLDDDFDLLTTHDSGNDDGLSTEHGRDSQLGFFFDVSNSLVHG